MIINGKLIHFHPKNNYILIKEPSSDKILILIELNVKHLEFYIFETMVLCHNFWVHPDWTMK